MIERDEILNKTWHALRNTIKTFCKVYGIEDSSHWNVGISIRYKVGKTQQCTFTITIDVKENEDLSLDKYGKKLIKYLSEAYELKKAVVVYDKDGWCTYEYRDMSLQHLINIIVISRLYDD